MLKAYGCQCLRKGEVALPPGVDPFLKVERFKKIFVRECRRTCTSGRACPKERLSPEGFVVTFIPASAEIQRVRPWQGESVDATAAVFGLFGRFDIRDLKHKDVCFAVVEDDVKLCRVIETRDDVLILRRLEDDRDLEAPPSDVALLSHGPSAQLLTSKARELLAARVPSDAWWQDARKAVREGRGQDLLNLLERHRVPATETRAALFASFASFALRERLEEILVRWAPSSLTEQQLLARVSVRASPELLDAVREWQRQAAAWADLRSLDVFDVATRKCAEAGVAESFRRFLRDRRGDPAQAWAVFATACDEREASGVNVATLRACVGAVTELSSRLRQEDCRAVFARAAGALPEKDDEVVLAVKSRLEDGSGDEILRGCLRDMDPRNFHASRNRHTADVKRTAEHFVVGRRHAFDVEEQTESLREAAAEECHRVLLGAEQGLLPRLGKDDVESEDALAALRRLLHGRRDARGEVGADAPCIEAATQFKEHSRRVRCRRVLMEAVGPDVGLQEDDVLVRLWDEEAKGVRSEKERTCAKLLNAVEAAAIERRDRKRVASRCEDREAVLKAAAPLVKALLAAEFPPVALDHLGLLGLCALSWGDRPNCKKALEAAVPTLAAWPGCVAFEDLMTRDERRRSIQQSQMVRNAEEALMSKKLEVGKLRRKLLDRVVEQGARERFCSESAPPLLERLFNAFQIDATGLGIPNRQFWDVLFDLANLDTPTVAVVPDLGFDCYSRRNHLGEVANLAVKAAASTAAFATPLGLAGGAVVTAAAAAAPVDVPSFMPNDSLTEVFRQSPNLMGPTRRALNNAAAGVKRVAAYLAPMSSGELVAALCAGELAAAHAEIGSLRFPPRSGRDGVA